MLRAAAPAAKTRRHASFMDSGGNGESSKRPATRSVFLKDCHSRTARRELTAAGARAQVAGPRLTNQRVQVPRTARWLAPDRRALISSGTSEVFYTVATP
ncbi:hypothetical protein HPB50_023797 [Hyalomma asiaticum]|uniref:Uncharacterized protein n=1 Tax=Hyalomma asiaticum TaxID=266040 RepID=A0ACB7TMV1_HYAAI|nr:hypothetical protein HPB50_023797 [Hyalomma asiaticum]